MTYPATLGADSFKKVLNPARKGEIRRSIFWFSKT